MFRDSIDELMLASRTMSTTNFIILCVTVLVLGVLFSFVLFRMGFLQVGSLIVHRNQEGQTTMHSMDEENADTDSLLQSQLRAMTDSLRKRIYGMFNAYPACTMTKRALSSSLRFPLYDSIENNHFTKELMPDRFYEYRRRIASALEDEYSDVVSSVLEIQGCELPNELPPWNEAQPIIELFLDTWLLNVTTMVTGSAKQKIETYQKYLEIFTASKDKYRVSITKTCIEKNERYVRELTERSAQLNQIVEQRKLKLLVQA